MTSNRDDQPRGGLLLASGAGLLMVACCALPLLIAGGAVAGVGGLIRNPWVIGAGITLLVLAGAATRRHRRPRGNDSCTPPQASSTAPTKPPTQRTTRPDGHAPHPPRHTTPAPHRT